MSLRSSERWVIIIVAVLVLLFASYLTWMYVEQVIEIQDQFRKGCAGRGGIVLDNQCVKPLPSQPEITRGT